MSSTNQIAILGELICSVCDRKVLWELQLGKGFKADLNRVAAKARVKGTEKVSVRKTQAKLSVQVECPTCGVITEFDKEIRKESLQINHAY
ncbi:hypothetical protein LWE69_19760 [Paenibacillus sp. UKAQ_18]|nr:hypothetical protein [Paenibacillus sp. UKAQ_18]